MPGLVSINSTGISDRKLFEMNRLARVTRLNRGGIQGRELSHLAIFGQSASPFRGNIDLHTKSGVAISVSWGPRRKTCLTPPDVLRRRGRLTRLRRACGLNAVLLRRASPCFREGADLIASSGRALEPLVTHVYPLADYRTALATALDKKASGSIKVAFKF